MLEVPEMSDEEISSISSLDIIDEKIKQYKSLKNFYKNFQMSVKLLMNSTYGALGNMWFAGYLVHSAEAITVQGRDSIKYSIKATKHYFYNLWHKDTELHKKLGVTDVRKIPKESTVAVYGDTDSIFISFEPALNSCTSDYDINNADDVRDFILKFNEHRLAEYFEKAFKKYSDKFQVDNYLEFELEKISLSGIWLGKKKYVLDTIWADGVDHDSGTFIMPTGIETVQSSTPPFARNHLNDLIKMIFKPNIRTQDVINRLRELKEEFKLANISDISFVSTCNNYDKYVMNDSTKIEFYKRVGVHVRGAGIHNYKIKNSKKYRNRYELIKEGEKVKYYYTTEQDDELRSFSYVPGMFPVEIAPDIDYDKQFEKCIIDPINRFIKVMGLPLISPDLFYTQSIF